MSYVLSAEPLLSGLLGDPEISAQFTAEADLAAMLRFEIALARVQARLGLIPPAAAEAIAAACASFDADHEALAAGVARDGVAVPQLVRQLRAAVGEPHGKHVHFGATSQDVVDTSLLLRLREVSEILRDRCAGLCACIDALDDAYGRQPLMGRTRMQSAVPIAVGDRLRAWRSPLSAHLSRLDELSPRLFRIQLGGAAGTLEKYPEKAGEIVVALANELGLSISLQWHTDRAAIAEFASWLSLLAGSLGKIGQDVALMAQNEIAEIAISGAGGSSAMPHKQNPVRAETLVALARYCATLQAGMHQSLVHEQERSGAAWTLEWMLLPQLCVAAGASTRIAFGLLESVERIGAGA